MIPPCGTRQGCPLARRREGFTLMETMVAIAIVAILAMLAIPNFQNRIVVDQIVNALPLTDIVKPQIALSWATTQTFPADNAAAGLPPADKIVNRYIQAVNVKNGVIHITFGNSAHGLISGKILSLRPAVVEDAPIVPITWVCGFAEAPGKMTIQGENRTDVPKNYLPLNCRDLGK
jgi:type IV pilus assembly protein PilA